MRKHTAIILLAVAFVLTGCKDETKEKDLKTATVSEVVKVQAEVPEEKPELIIKDDFYTDPEKVKDFWQKSCSYFKRDANKSEELADLNRKYWKMEKVWPSDVQNREILVSARDSVSGAVYFLIYDNFDYKIMVVDNANAKIHEKYTIPRFRNGDPANGYAMKMSVNNGCVLLWIGNWAWCSVAGKKQMHFISEIPMFPIISMWKNFDNRIMILGENMLLSCNETGRNRKIHFSGRQAAKTLEIQKQNPQGKFIFGTSGKDIDSSILLFSCGFSELQLCRYNLSVNSIEKLASLPGGNTDWFFTLRDGNDIFINFTVPPVCDISIQMQYNIADSKIKVLSAVDYPYPGREKNDLVSNVKVKLEKLRRAGGTFTLVNNRYLIYNGYTVPYRRMNTKGGAGVIDLKQFPHGAVLKMPSVNGIYSFDGNTLFAVEFNQITKLTPVNRK